MVYLNKVMLMGVVWIHPEQREFEGSAITFADLVTHEHWKNHAGEQQAHTELHNLVFFKKLAEIAKNQLTTGSQIFIQGRLRTREWKYVSGLTDYSTQIDVDHLQIVVKNKEPPVSSGDEGYDDDIIIDEYHVSDSEL